MYINAAPEGSSISRYDTLKQVEKSTGRRPPELDQAPKLTNLHNDVLEAYSSLTEYTYSEIDSYIRLTGNPLASWEVEAIMRLAKYRGATPVWPLKKA